MITKLEEAIAHAREVANEKRFMEDHWTKQDKDDKWHDKRQSWITECKECAKEHEQLAEWLTELAERREADRWIPVSERLPDKNGKCLVSLDFGDVSMDSFVDGIFVCYLGNVTHWKPLPKPYTESEDK